MDWRVISPTLVLARTNIVGHRGPDMPCFLNILKCEVMRIDEMIGGKKVCMLYNRDNLPDLILNPPLSIRTNTNPIPGTKMSSASGTSVTILHAQ